MTSRFAHRSAIEPLEARIAPALLVNGANLLGGAGNPTTGETSVGENAVTLVKVLSGQALVWFDNGSIYSISFGPNTTLEVTGNILGDVVGNLNADGTLSDSDNNPANGEDGSQLLANNLLGLTTKPLSGEKGSLRNVITGGSIANLNVSGELVGAYAGDGVFRAESDLLSAGQVQSSVGVLDINPVISGKQSTFTFTKAGSSLLPGASIRTGKITLAPALQLFAGSGNPTGAIFAGPGPAGGSISNITIDSAVVPSGSPVDTPSYWLIAGDGAVGKNGGAGGSISYITEKASFGRAVMTAGDGGAGTGAAGGVGGSVSFLDVQSNSARYVVTAGDGGSGAPAGDGGRLLFNNFSNRTPVSGLIKAADFTGDGIDDVLIIDAATGQMIINSQDGQPGGAGAPYQQIVQTTKAGTDVVLIDPVGVSPSDVLVKDLNADGDLDILVAYKNSNSLGVFLNRGNGVFFDPTLGTSGEFASVAVGLSYSPSKIATDGTAVAIAENREGGSFLRYGFIGGLDVDEIKFEESEGVNEFSQPVADVVFGQGEFIAGFTSGAVSKLQTAGLSAKKAFLVTKTDVAITGGISDLEVDSTGTRLLALSSVGFTTTVFDISGASYSTLATIPLSAGVTPLAAHFVRDANPATPDEIAVLGVLPTGSLLTSYSQNVDGDPATPDPFTTDATFSSTSTYKNFVPAYSASGFIGHAALAGSMNSFLFTPDLVSTTEFPLPFASKIIEATAGDGGTGLNLGKLIGRGGAGGGILGLNADGNEIIINAGNGGAAGSGAGGAGGSVVNPPTFVTAAGVSIVPTLVADVVLQIETGDGGTPTGPNAKTATGGAGGSLAGLTITLDSGDITLTTGRGGDGRGGAAGAGGSFNGVKTLGRDGDLTLETGAGGNALSGAVAGGAGGSILNFSHELALDSETEVNETAYSVTITTGAGGTSVGGTGGAGGSLGVVTLKIDGSDRTYDDLGTNPPLTDANKDSTVRISVTTGDGGSGLNGGAGGTIRDLAHTSVFDQETRSGGVFLNYVVMQLTAGNGGAGTAGNGGAGGNIALSRAISGVTYFDPDAANPADPASRSPFIATAGDGGDGSLRGGAGGSVSGVRLQNAAFKENVNISSTHLESAIINAGNGGNGGSLDGGAGGSVSNLLVGAQARPSAPADIPNGIFKGDLSGGFITVEAGAGGNGGASGRGGAGGAVGTSTVGLVSTVVDLGLSINGGRGGNGALGGGVGGALSGLQISTPQSTDGISAILEAGDGGNSTSNRGAGGKGGDVLNITQGKDINSSINLIQAGNGGNNASGTGGAGGNVAGIRTVGFIGRPSDGVNRLGVFDQIGSGPGAVEFAQGVFSGRGGDGILDGINGSVTNVSARQIAAIAAAVDSGKLFAAASKVSGIRASLIAFDRAQDSVFTSTVPGVPNPKTSIAVDGFVLSATPLSQVTGLPASSSYVFIG